MIDFGEKVVNFSTKKWSTFGAGFEGLFQTIVSGLVPFCQNGFKKEVRKVVKNGRFLAFFTEK